MDVAGIEDILARLSGQLDDDEILDCARWARVSEARLGRFRAAWPTDRLPVVGDYYCVARLGQGASGVVFKALSLAEEPRFVALKLLQFGSPEAEDRFREREIEILKSLNCPHVSRYLGSGRAGGTMYLVMELVDGLPLDDYLAAHNGDLEAKLDTFRRLCEVVAGLHAQGVIHRDLKPKHVLVDRQGQPWIVDFGLSTVSTEDWPTRVRRAQTELGAILGTVKYMSPEQAWGGLLHLDHRTDIWSLGIMLYEIVTDGGFPYDLGPIDDLSGHEALLHRLQTETPKRPEIASPEYGDALVTLLSRCLAHEPEHRIDSARALAGDLARCVAMQSIQTSRLPLSYRAKRIAVGLAAQWRLGLWASTVCAVLVFLLAVSVVFHVRWFEAGQDYGKDTRMTLAGDGQLAGDDIVVVGISDESIGAVPALAGELGVAGVGADIRSWRALHGRLMLRLAQAGPRAVVWDYFFRTAQPGDAAFVEGARALDRAGVPVVLALQRHRPDGTPDLSPALHDPAIPSDRVGLILTRDMVEREGEFVLALRRGDEVHPALVLSAFAAVVHPECSMDIDWQDAPPVLRLIYHPASPGDEPPAVDPVGLTTIYETARWYGAARPGDKLACKAFELELPAAWRERTVAYEELLAAGDQELRELVGGRVVLVGDLRSPRESFRDDRKRVSYGGQIVTDVPGCYLVANGLAGLLANRSLSAGGAQAAPLNRLAFLGVLISAALGCLIPPRIASGRWLRTVWARRLTLGLCVAGAVGGTAVMVFTHQWYTVHAGMLCAALLLSLAASFAIEFARNRYRVRRGA